ncbi:MAG TPA: hypothetical protein VJ992_16150 [Gemmatimonadales bacterium]|nr:hypothetical protein [Gemmatimonadales bacterium]
MTPERSTVPGARLHVAHDAPLRSDGAYVLYWMVATRRLGYSFALARAVELATELRRPLLIFEALRVDYPWATARAHRFVLDGMAEHARRLGEGPVGYYPYVEPVPGAGKGLLAALAARACAVVTDWSPAFFYPQLLAAGARQIGTRLEAVDDVGLAPVAATDKQFGSAYAFRRWLQQVLPDHLDRIPPPDPLTGAAIPPFEGGIPGEIASRWPAADDALLEGDTTLLARLPIDHAVSPTALRGGTGTARARLDRFVAKGLGAYGARHDPLTDPASGLSPFLHFGQISTHEVLIRVAAEEGWRPDRVAATARGNRAGWWGMREAAEAFLDQLVTWRELGFHAAARDPRYRTYDGGPDWARATLEAHAGDRHSSYTLDALDAAGSDDRLWNATQGQLRTDGVVQSYLRMIWGKRILEWGPDPGTAFAWAVELNNRYALDGRDPNSYSGISWCFGRYDRPWGPERPIFGTVRYMSSANTARKMRLQAYLDRYAPAGE